MVVPDFIASINDFSKMNSDIKKIRNPYRHRKDSQDDYCISMYLHHQLEILQHQ